MNLNEYFKLDNNLAARELDEVLKELSIIVANDLTLFKHLEKNTPPKFLEDLRLDNAKFIVYNGFMYCQVNNFCFSASTVKQNILEGGTVIDLIVEQCEKLVIDFLHFICNFLKTSSAKNKVLNLKKDVTDGFILKVFQDEDNLNAIAQNLKDIFS
jgi:hypothetical protein